MARALLVKAKALLIAAVLVAAGIPALHTPIVTAAGSSCQSIERAVAVAPGRPLNQTISGTLCTPDTWAGGVRQIDVLVHGGTYNRGYWDFPVKAPFYSHVQRTLHEGRATFAYDRLGTGTSSRPSSLQATIQSDAYILHQLVQWLNPQFDKLTTIGHSLGSLVAMNEANLYNDVDRLVVTGILHALGPSVATFPTALYPAALDAQFAGLLDLGYLTTTPGSRGQVFYNATADPAVVAYDEAHKDKSSTLQIGAAFTTLLPPALSFTNAITAPVLVMSGSQDSLTCGLLLDCNNQAAVLAHETPFYPASANLTTQTIPDTGHNIALHPTAPNSFMVINNWIESH